MNPEKSSLGTNRTGLAMSPFDSPQLVKAAAVAPPSSNGNVSALRELRRPYEGDVVGSVPPPLTAKGVVSSLGKALQGESMTVFIDKLGERLAFERTGARLYEAFLDKLTDAAVAHGPPLDHVRRIHDAERAHATMIAETIRSVGGDPTAMTPAADVMAVASMGLPQALHDPRTTWAQCLDALLMVELVDNDGWRVLVELANGLGQDTLAERFRQAWEEEDSHLANVRAWALDATLRAGGVERTERIVPGEEGPPAMP